MAGNPALVDGGGPTTFPRLLLQHAAVRGDRPAMREKDLGIWQSHSWAKVRDEVAALAGGLAAMGFKRGDNLAIIGENRPRLYWALTAAQALGGVPVPMYQDAVAQEMVFAFQNADIAFAIVEDQEQVDKMLEIQLQCPALKHIVFDDSRGMRRYHQPGILSFEKLQELGREFNKNNPGFFEAEIEKGKPSDMAALFFTSGTTGLPKGVVLTHQAMIATGRTYSDFEGMGADEELLAYLPMAWIGQNLFSYTQSMVAGFCVSCPESAETVMTDMREIGPTYYFAPPRVLEGLLTTVMIRMEDAGWLKRRAFHYFMALARRVGAKMLDGREPVGLFDRLQYALGDLLIFGPLRNSLGMSRVKVAYTAGEAIGPDLFVFYSSIGINLNQLYGQTETTVYVCVQPNGVVKPDTVGPPLPGVEIKLKDDGEILVKTPGLFEGYYRNEEATRESKDADGWFHTGDAGFFDAEGHLKIIDRAKDVGRLTDGTMFAPKYLENKLKFFPHIKEAVAFGDGREHATAMINIDVDAVGDWAERHNLGYSGYTDLAGKREVYELIRDCIARVNLDLAQDPKLANSQIHRFVILHKELDADDGELTRTRKVRRRIIADKYAAIIEALYGAGKSVQMEAQVKFEDGRSGTIRADLAIAEAPVHAPAEAARMIRKAA
ncbi:MAG: AMP-binding protein [Betaproteobacteria bacterium]|nr:AMP-binding protein [Betaproteobacteria bacterium]